METSSPTLTTASTGKKSRRAIATILSCVLPGSGQVALGKNRTAIAFIGTFCFLAFLYWPLRLPRFYFGFAALFFALVALFVVSAWHALRSPSSQSSGASRWWLALVLPFALLGSFAHHNWLTFAAGFRPFYVPGSGMEKTIMQGEHVMVDLKQYRNASPKRGDIIVFRKEGVFEVKRVIALAGDTIEGQDVSVFLNKHSQDEPYAFHKYAPHYDPDQLNTFGPVAVAPGEIFVIGDNRDVSIDSRMSDFGLVDDSSITGRALYRCTLFVQNLTELDRTYTDIPIDSRKQ
jgi:signal peptidase I